MQRLTTLILSLFAGTAILPAAAEAACGTTGNAYGDFWIERSGANCDCVVQMFRYSCNANAGGHDYASTPATVATISGDCDAACEDLPGYDAAIAAAEARWDPSNGTTSATAPSPTPTRTVGARAWTRTTTIPGCT